MCGINDIWFVGFDKLNKKWDSGDCLGGYV